MKKGMASLGLVLAASLVAACSGPGSDESAAPAAPEESVEVVEGENSGAVESGDLVLPVTVDAVAALGDVTLNVWADGGEESTMGVLVPKFESMYPNVKVNVTLKGFDDLMSTVVPALSGDSAPDVAQGNQGYAVDGTLVKAGLIRPLDDVAEAYGWNTSFNPADFGQFSWTDGGLSFGQGTLYGMSPVTEFVGVFYNKSKLQSLGLDVPATHADFVQALETAKGAGELPIMMGNSDKYPATHVFGLVQGAFTPPQETRDWIGGTPGSTFDSATNVTALEQMRSWVEAGYFPKGFDGISADDATAKFGSGEGVFLLGGTWNAGAIQETLGEGAGFIANPAGESGMTAGTGSLGLGWHISSKTEVLPAAVAFLGMLMAEETAQELANLNRIPASKATITAANPLFEEQLAGAAEVLGDGGQTYYFDWATNSMYDVFTASLQEFLAGKISAADFISNVQGDWDTFQAENS
jgi:ABC-type glycerol-3-phosphate transport system substrate-binding protein